MIIFMPWYLDFDGLLYLYYYCLLVFEQKDSNALTRKDWWCS